MALTEVDQIADMSFVPRGTEVLNVVVATSYDKALERVTEDESRGLSRDPQFLREQYDLFATELPRLPCDLLLDTSDTSVTELVDLVVERLSP